MGAYSADGQTLAYITKITENYPFKRYRGGLASDIYLYDVSTKNVENITNSHAIDGASNDGREEQRYSLAAADELKSSNQTPLHRLGEILTPRIVPPSGNDIGKTDEGNALCRLEPAGSVPSWLNHSSSYGALRRDRGRLGTTSRTSQSAHNSRNYFRPVHLPPSSTEVASWYRKKFGKSPNQSVMRQSSRKRAPSDAGFGDGLEIDGNSRMFVSNRAKMLRRKEASAPIPEAQSVEEVHWESSQPMHFSATQLTPPDTSSSSQPHPSFEALSTESKTIHSSSGSQTESHNSGHALDGIGNQGGRIHVQGGGGLKAKTKASQLATLSSSEYDDGDLSNRYMDSLPSPITFMSIEIHVQCRTGFSRLDGKKISMAPNSSKDKVVAVTFVFGQDPGGGEPLKITERGCLFIPLEAESDDHASQVSSIRSSMPRVIMGTSADLLVELVKDETRLLHRVKDIVRMRDPDMLLSWDTQGSGLGYLIERGLQIGRAGHDEVVSSTETNTGLDLARLLGRTPNDSRLSSFTRSAQFDSCLRTDEEMRPLDVPKQREAEMWKGSGLGSDWDERVGAGAAAASIVSFDAMPIFKPITTYWI